MGASGFYYYFGAPFISLTVKHGTMGDIPRKHDWYLLPDVMAMSVDIVCWLSLFLGVVAMWNVIRHRRRDRMK